MIVKIGLVRSEEGRDEGAGATIEPVGKGLDDLSRKDMACLLAGGVQVIKAAAEEYEKKTGFPMTFAMLEAMLNMLTSQSAAVGQFTPAEMPLDLSEEGDEQAPPAAG